VSDPTAGPGRSVFEVVVEGLLAVDFPDVEGAITRGVAAAAAAHATGMPDLTRLGVRMAGAALVAICLLPAHGHLGRLPPARRGRLLDRFGRLPVAGEYIRLARGLGLVCYYERLAS
jgi:hypothetical protein